MCNFTHKGSAMIVQCQGCTAKYFLPQDKLPVSPIKVRCPKCTAVFTLVPQPEPVGVGAAVAPGPAPAGGSVQEYEIPGGIPEQVTPDTPPVSEEVASAVAVEQAPAAEPKPKSKPKAKPSKPAKTKKKPGGRSKEDRAKRLARVLVSDILCYNREKRDQALQDGTLMTVLGEEIKKSWELYKEKIGPELANSTNYFKEALNEILADGKEVF